MTGLCVKKCRGRSSSVTDSTGMMGKSSGEGKWLRPKVCQRTMSSSSTLSDPSPSQSTRPTGVSPDVWGTWRPAGQSWSSASEQRGGDNSQGRIRVGRDAARSGDDGDGTLTLGHMNSVARKGGGGGDSECPRQRAKRRETKGRKGESAGPRSCPFGAGKFLIFQALSG